MLQDQSSIGVSTGIRSGGTDCDVQNQVVNYISGERASTAAQTSAMISILFTSPAASATFKIRLQLPAPAAASVPWPKPQLRHNQHQAPITSASISCCCPQAQGRLSSIVDLVVGKIGGKILLRITIAWRDHRLDGDISYSNLCQLVIHI